MVEYARKQLEGTQTLVLAVTVLTSIDSKTCQEIYHRLPLPQVLSLAKIAYNAGAHGFVCSPDEEAAALRKLYPDALIVCPGCRSLGTDTGDQSRIASFTEAKDAGANFMVGGRQFLGAQDSVEEVLRVLSEELGLCVN
jgi:orotidine-5'-phosphate decarboxylase